MGYFEPNYDSDFWADHDEDWHGIIDSNWSRREYLGGFTWTCCGEKGDETEGFTSEKGNY